MFAVIQHVVPGGACSRGSKSGRGTVRLQDKEIHRPLLPEATVVIGITSSSSMGAQMIDVVGHYIHRGGSLL